MQKVKNQEEEKESQVETLSLGLFRIDFREIGAPEISLPSENQIGDYGAPIVSAFPWEPKWFINGWYSKINHGMINTFIIDPEGPHTIYITQLPIRSNKDTSLSSLTKGTYKLLYKEAWKENRKNSTQNQKYILQII